MKLLEQLQHIREGELVEINKFGISPTLTIRVRAGKASRKYIEENIPTFAQCNVTSVYYSETDRALKINVCSE